MLSCNDMFVGNCNIFSIISELHGTIKTVILLRRNQLGVLTHTDCGILLVYKIKQKIWKILLSDHQYGSYAVAKINHLENYVVFGNTKGNLT